MNRRNRSTHSGGFPLLGDPLAAKARGWGPGVRLTMRALIELLSSRRRLATCRR